METSSTQTTDSRAALVSVGLRYGLFLGLVWIILDFLLRQVGFGFLIYGSVTLLASVAVSVVMLVIAHRFYKHNNSGRMTFREGLGISLIMLLLSGIMSALFNYVYMHYIDPDFVARMRDQMVEFMERNNVPDEQIEKSTASIEKMRGTFGESLISGLTSGVLMGVIIGSIVSAFTRYRTPDFE